MGWSREPPQFQTHHTHWSYCPRDLAGITTTRRIVRTKEGLVQPQLSARDRLLGSHSWRQGQIGVRLGHIHSYRKWR